MSISIDNSINILYYKTNFNKKNSEPYIAVVVCLLVMLNQWKQLNLLFIQLQRDFFCGVYLEFQHENALCPSDGDLLLITEHRFTDKTRKTITAFT